MLTGQSSFFHGLGTEASENQTHSENEKYVWLSWELNYKATPPRLRRGKAVMSGCQLLVHLLVLSGGLSMVRSVVAPHSQQNTFQVSHSKATFLRKSSTQNNNSSTVSLAVGTGPS